MKLNKWLCGVMAFGMLAACSNEEPLVGGGTDETGEGFVGIKIQLPTVPSTRANDIFDHGVAGEYAIEDAQLLLFQGADAATATCTGVFTLKNGETLSDTNDQITSHVTRVANVSGIQKAADNKIFALVLVNTGVNSISTGGLVGKTIQGMQETILTDALYTQATPGVGTANNIFMTNSPLSLNKGGQTNPGTISGALPVLVELEKTVYPTEREALAKPAGVIHVERAVGKITCSQFEKKTGIKVTVDGKEYTLTVDKIWWDMAQDMNKTYLVRNTNRKIAGSTTGTNMWTWNLASTASNVIDEKYRMLGHTPIDVTVGDVTTSYYRPYFCQVPGYDTDREKTDFNKTELIFGDNTQEWSSTGAFYPRENTFPVACMTYKNTTRIGFWVTYKFVAADATELDMAAKNFYVKGADNSVLYTDDEDGNDPLTNLALASLSNNDDIKEAVTKAFDTTQAGSFSMEDIGDLLNITYADTKDGLVKIASISFKPYTDDIYHDDAHEGIFKAAPEYSFTSLLEGLNELGEFYKYEDGRAFYEVRIKHFGDDLTPWSVGELDPATTIEESYGEVAGSARNANFLGRYGIVRNNWYDLNITDILKIGQPVDPARWDTSWPGKPDDNKEQYIAVELKVLSWAKRTQSHKF